MLNEIITLIFGIISGIALALTAVAIYTDKVVRPRYMEFWQRGFDSAKGLYNKED